MEQHSQEVLAEIKKIINGKDEIIEKIWMAILSQGHILLEDVPGVGKTTLALAFSKALGLTSNRIQFTPDVVASDVIGFTMYDKQKGAFIFKEGAIMCNLLLGDEINRTSSRTQSALLEAMQEGNVTVDGITYELPKPFHVLATQNPLGTFGTQPLPQAQLDRFLVKLSIGYPDFNSQVELLKNRQLINPIDKITPIVSKEQLLQLQQQAMSTYIADDILRYVTALTEKTREHEHVLQGVSPRGALAVCNMAKAHAFTQGRSYVIPEDVQKIWIDTCRHRIVLQQNTMKKNTDDFLKIVLDEVPTPDVQALIQQI